MTQETETYSFSCVNDGAPINSDDLPKLPPRAVTEFINTLAKIGVKPEVEQSQGTTPEQASALNEIAMNLVYYTLRRIDPNVTRDAILDGEDWEEVMACWRGVQRRNPLLFQKAQAPPKNPVLATRAQRATQAASGEAPAPTGQAS